MSKYLGARGKGANTFPFHNLPPLLKKFSKRSFSILFTLSLIWIKEKSVANFAYHNICKHKRNTSINSRFCHCISELATLLGNYKKWGYLRVSSF